MTGTYGKDKIGEVTISKERAWEKKNGISDRESSLGMNSADL